MGNTALQVGDTVLYALPEGTTIGGLTEVPCVVGVDGEGRATFTYHPEGGEPVVMDPADESCVRGHHPGNHVVGAGVDADAPKTDVQP